jgi:hypothetical protein
MKAIVLIVLVVTTTATNAQYNADTIHKKYSTGLLYRLGGSFMKGNQKLTFQELGKEFSMSDVGLDQYNLAKRKRTEGKIFFYTGLACGIIAGTVGPKNKNLGFAFIGGQMISLSFSARSNATGNRFLDQAIQIRNKDYLFPNR